MKTNRTVCLLALLTLPGLTTSCTWDIPEDDAGDEAFVAWVVPTVLARRPYSHDETAALALIAEEHGREAVVDILMDQPEFVTYWSRVLVDDLRLQREVRQGQSVVDAECYGEGMLNSIYDEQLVDHLQTAGWQEPFCPEDPTRDLGYSSGRSGSSSTASEKSDGELTMDDLLAYQREMEAGSYTTDSPEIGSGVPPLVPDGGQELRWTDEPLTVGEAGPTYSPAKLSKGCQSFNMTDVFRAAMAEDQLEIVFRAQLAVLAAYGGNRMDMSTSFQLGWLDRDPACIGCHNSTYSTTDARPLNGEWDRFYPSDMGVDVEGSAYSYHELESEDGNWFFNGSAGSNKLDGFFNPETRINEGVSAFGLASECVNGGFDPEPDFDATPAAFAGLPLVGGLTTMNLIDQFREGVKMSGVTGLHSVYNTVGPETDEEEGCGVEASDDVVDCETLFAVNCVNCHNDGSPDAPGDLFEHTRHMTPERIYTIVVNGSPAGGMRAMELGEPGDTDSLTDEGVRELVDWMVTQSDHEQLLMYNDGSVGFVQLVAQSMVNHVVEEISGSRLALSHGFPRTQDAAEAQGLLTAKLMHDWSLRELVKDVVLSEFANRRAPAETVGGAYELPPVMEPWDLINPDALEPGETVTSASVYNGEGDKVHRWSVPNLLLQVHHALGWSAPPIIPDNDYPTLAFQEELGGFVNNQNTGFAGTDMAVMLAWEDKVASCRLDGYWAGLDGGQPTEEWGTDFIGLVTSEAAELTMGEAMLAVKDRLISYGDWWPVSGSGGLADEKVVSEQMLAAELAAEMGGYELTDLASDEPDVVRAYCGMLLRSPQFMLSGLAAWPEDELPDSLDGLPCNDELCGFMDYCEEYGEAAEAHGYGRIECEKKGSDTLSYGRY